MQRGNSRFVKLNSQLYLFGAQFLREMETFLNAAELFHPAKNLCCVSPRIYVKAV